MIWTQIQLTDEQARLLREVAAAKGRSMADLVRDAVATLLNSEGRVAREALKRRSLESLGRFHSGARDLASAHDRYLDDAFPR
jgi:plasmid stability protein